MKRRQGCTWPGILSNERFVVRVADAFWMVAGNMFVINMMRERPGPRCPSPHGRVYVFRRDLGGLSAAHRHGRGRQRVGIADQRMHGREKSDALIRSDEACEQSMGGDVAEWVERRGAPEGKQEALARTGHRAGFVCYRRAGHRIGPCRRWTCRVVDYSRTSCVGARPEGGAGYVSAHVQICAGPPAKPGGYRDVNRIR